jgi:hypothetical protein
VIGKVGTDGLRYAAVAQERQPGGRGARGAARGGAVAVEPPVLEARCPVGPHGAPEGGGIAAVRGRPPRYNGDRDGECRSREQVKDGDHCLLSSGYL